MSENMKLFHRMLEIGQAFEVLAIEQIIKHYKNKYKLLNTCNDNRYDFMLTNNKQYEVKADLMANKTGNLFIENVQFNKPSGIDVTTADYYIVIYQKDNMNVFLKIKTKQIKKLIQKGIYSRYHIDKNKSGYIFNLSLFESHCTEI